MTDHVHWYHPLGGTVSSRGVYTPPGYPHPLRCEICGHREHPAACYDDDGKLECACGLEVLLEREAAAQLAAMESGT